MTLFSHDAGGASEQQRCYFWCLDMVLSQVQTQRHDLVFIGPTFVVELDRVISILILSDLKKRSHSLIIWSCVLSE